MISKNSIGLAFLFAAMAPSANSAGKPAPPPPPSSGFAPLTVVDSVGKAVGRFVPNGIYVTLNNVPVWINLVSYRPSLAAAQPSGAQLGWNTDSSLAFPTTDCTGQGYFQSQTVAGSAQGVILFSFAGAPYLYTSSALVTAPVQMASRFINGACIPSPYLMDVIPASAPIDATAVGVPPFTIQ